MPVLRSSLLLAAMTLAGAPPDDSPVFRSDVQRVLVPVVVRDANGRVISNLTREHFRLREQGKEQPILDFTVDQPSTALLPSAIPDSAREQAPNRRNWKRFLVYFFDDRNISFHDMERARSALDAHLSGGLAAGTLGAVATSSGFTMPFSRDADALLKAARQIKPTVATENGLGCPEISYYLADQIVNRRNLMALAAAGNQVRRCNPGVLQKFAEMIAQTQAENVLRLETQQTRASLQMLAESVARLAGVRGTRELIVISTGLQVVSEQRVFDKLLEGAISQGVRVSAVNAHGIHGIGMDMSRQMPLDSFTVAALRWRSDTLATMAETTGGRYARQTNGLKQALDHIAAEPETTYVLGFAPKFAGKPGTFRKLEVELVGLRGLQVQARRGYLSSPPTEAPSPIQTARAALMSRADVRQLALKVSARRDGGNTVVLAHIRAEGVNLQPCDRQSCGSLTFVFGLFDENGVLLHEVVRKADLRLNEAGRQAFLTNGIQVSAEFASPPPRYCARVAAVDAGSGRIGSGSL